MAGRGRRPKKLEEQINILEDLTVEGALRILRGKDEKRKFIIIKDLAGKVLARRVRLGGEGEKGEFIMKVVRVDPETDGRNIPIARFSIPSVQ